VSDSGDIVNSVSSERLLLVALGLTLSEYSYVPLRPRQLSGLVVAAAEHLCGLCGGTVLNTCRLRWRSEQWHEYQSPEQAKRQLSRLGLWTASPQSCVVSARRTSGWRKTSPSVFLAALRGRKGGCVGVRKGGCVGVRVPARSNRVGVLRGDFLGMHPCVMSSMTIVLGFSVNVPLLLAAVPVKGIV